MTVTDHDSVLQVDCVEVRHGETLLAHVRDVRLEPGRPVTIVGESGSGKSIFAHAVMGTLPDALRAEGTMTIDGEQFDLGQRRHRRLWGTRLALLPQEPMSALDPTMRVRPQVAEGARGWRPRARRFDDLAQDRLAGMGLAEAGAAYPHELSGGMAQRVAFAAATIGGAPLLIVDEPSKGLDSVALDRLADLLTRHLNDGGALLMITHDLELARRIGGELLVMQDASVVESGDVERVLAQPSHDYTRMLVSADPRNWQQSWRRDVSSEHHGELLIRASGLAKSYGAHQVFADVDVTIGAGERWAVTGPSGSGKTTLGDALLGLTSIDSGSIWRSEQADGARFQKLYQDPALSFPPRVALAAAMGDVGRRFDVPEASMHALIERVGLSPDLLIRRPSQVSGGELQRLAVVRAMVTRPALVFADEATSRLDLISQRLTVDVLMSELEASDAALLLVTHDRALAGAVTDRQIVLGSASPTADLAADERGSAHSSAVR